jgi:hypothetical protein
MADIDVVPKTRTSKGWVLWTLGIALIAIALWMLLGGTAATVPN